MPIAAILNIGISIGFVYWLGLVGIAIGTLVAMTYQMLWMGLYVSKKLLQIPISRFLKRIAVDAICILLIFGSTEWIDLVTLNYGSWVWMAIKVALVSSLDILIISLIFYKDYCLTFIKHTFKKLHNKQSH